MKKYIYFIVFILLIFSIANCQGSRISQLEATNQALSGQVSSLLAQMTQSGISPIKTTQAPSNAGTESALPALPSISSPSPVPSGGQGVIAPTLIVSGSGAITPWTNHQGYPSALFGAANVHMLCDPNDTVDGEIYIDNKSMTRTCKPGSESWAPWRQDITVGDHYIYSANANDKYEFWTMGTTPFTISNKFSSSDYMFKLSDSGIFNLSANLIKGQFTLYLTCEKAQNFDYQITQSTTIPIVLQSAQCKLLIRDYPPGTLTPGEIEVSLQFVK